MRLGISLSLTQPVKRGTPYSPLSNPSLKMWLESTTLAGAIGSGIATWPDSSGSGNSAAQATGALQPTVQANTSDGQKTARFVDLNFMSIGASTDLNGTTGYTQLIVASKPTLSPGGAVIWKNSSIGWTWVYDPTSGGLFQVQSGASILAITKYIPGRLHIAVVRVTGATARQSYGDGFANLSDTVTSPSDTGGTFLGTTPNLTADTCTIRHFNTALTASVITNEMAYEARRHDGHNVVCLGDSLTIAFYTVNTYPYQFNALITTGMMSVSNNGVAGQTILDAIAGISAQAGAFILSGWPYNVASVWIGTNDIYFGATGAQTISRFTTYCGMLRTMGFVEIIVQPILPRSDAGTPAGFWTEATVFNTWLAANWQTIASAYFNNNATALVTGGNTLNPTYNFNSDGVHLNDAGYAIIASGIQTAYNSIP